ncbi:MAG TPA: hypothetical protein PK156_20035 [Polyangium sp.]|nr:hypothetical protein [Polyangium sp.]
MASRLQRCPACRVHIFADATSCPFCSTHLPLKGIIATTVGVVTLIAGIGCAYGCPDNECVGGFGGAAGAGGAGGESTTGSTSSGMAGAGGASINDAGTD